MSALQLALPDSSAAYGVPLLDAGEAPPADMPSGPSRDDVYRALSERAAAVRACVPAGESGRLSVFVEFAPTGRVNSVEVESSLPEDAEACVARAVRVARLAPFRQPHLRVRFPHRY